MPRVPTALRHTEHKLDVRTTKETPSGCRQTLLHATRTTTGNTYSPVGFIWLMKRKLRLDISDPITGTTVHLKRCPLRMYWQIFAKNRASTHQSAASLPQRALEEEALGLQARAKEK